MSLAPLNPIQMLPARDRVAAALREAIFKAASLPRAKN